MNDRGPNHPDLHVLAGIENPNKDVPIRPLKEIQDAYIKMVVQRCDGNVLNAAKLLKISPSTIYRRYKKSDK